MLTNSIAFNTNIFSFNKKNNNSCSTCYAFTKPVSFRGIYFPDYTTSISGRIIDKDANTNMVQNLIKRLDKCTLTDTKKNGRFYEFKFSSSDKPAMQVNINVCGVKYRIEIKDLISRQRWFIESVNIDKDISKKFNKYMLDKTGIRILPKSEFFIKLSALTLNNFAKTRLGKKIEKLLDIPGRNIDIEKLDIKIPNLPAELEGFTMLQLSDIHAGLHMRDEYLARLVSKCNELNPDIVLLTGDYTDKDSKYSHDAVKHLSKLQSKIGIWAVMGNHDIWNGIDETHEIFVSNNINMLRNECNKFYINKSDPEIVMRINLGPNKDFDRQANFYLVGIDDYLQGTCDRPNAFKHINKSPDNLVIIMSHTPDAVKTIDSSQYHLMLSGHLHGGQVNSKLYNPKDKYIPSIYGKKYMEGLHKTGNNSFLYVNRGIGATNIPIRKDCNPEITFITLKRAPHSPSNPRTLYF